jgi:hypothetical protein
MQLARLADIEEDLVNLRHQLVNLARNHRDQRLSEWLQVDGTVALRDNASDYATLDIWSEILRTKAEIKILEDEREHLKFVLEHNG